MNQRLPERIQQEKNKNNKIKDDEELLTFFLPLFFLPFQSEGYLDE
jgi:hypothetical protein